MIIETIHLRQIAHARSGDKGADCNIGVIAYTPSGYEAIRDCLTAEKVKEYFASLGVTEVIRYELPNLGALNFILKNVLDGGGNLCLRLDSQGKALGQAILEMQIPVKEHQLPTMISLEECKK